MSWNSLPDDLIAHITSHMEYSDIWNLMKTCKRHDNVIKAYGKDKIAMEYINFVGPIVSRKQSFEALSNEGQEHTSLICKLFDEHATLAENVKNILEKCSSVRSIGFCFHRLTTDLYKVLMETKTKIGIITVTQGEIKFGGQELVSFCQKFKGCSFDSSSLQTEILTDDILVPVIAAATNITWKKFEPQEVTGSATLVTDRTLRALFGGKPKLCCVFQNVHNCYTIKELVRLLKGLNDPNYKLANCDLGILQSDQFFEAERYFNEYTGELRHDYKIKVFNRSFFCKKKYQIVIGEVYNYKNERIADARIVFSVIKP